MTIPVYGHKLSFKCESTWNPEINSTALKTSRFGNENGEVFL